MPPRPRRARISYRPATRSPMANPCRRSCAPRSVSVESISTEYVRSGPAGAYLTGPFTKGVCVRMLRTAGLVLILGLSSACSQASPPTSKPTIALGEMTVRFDGNPIAKLHADGRTESVGNSKPGKDATFSPGPTLHADGTIDLTKGGYRARVDA